MNKRAKIAVLSVSCVYVVVWFLVTNYAANAYVSSRFAAQQEQARQQVSLAKSTLEAILFKDVYLADSLATVVNIEPQFAIDNWQSISKKLMADSSHVRNVAMAPDNTIQYIYPLAGNEQTLGFRYQDRPDQFEYVQRAQRSGKVVIDGPRELIQGGIGLIVRFPIFSDYPISMEYWGVVSVVIDYDAIMKEAGFNDFERVEVALRHDQDQQQQSVFFGRPETFETADFTLPVTLPSGRWQMAAKYNLALDSNEQTLLYGLWVASAALALLIYLAILTLFRSFHAARQHALHDELTKLPNRRFLMNYIEGLISRRGAPPQFAIINVDLNHFKKVNDELGHDAGDALLRHIAKLMLMQVRATDLVARIGGDEFIIVLNRITEEASVRQFVDTLKANIERSPLPYKDQLIYPSLSVGFALSDGKKSREALLSEADAAMYKMKIAHRTGH